MAPRGNYRFGGFVLEAAQCRLLRNDGEAVELTPRLFTALLYFVEHQGVLLGKDLLLQAIWPGLVVDENNLNQVVAALRKILGDEVAASRFIQTVPRHGFRFIAPVHLVEASTDGPLADSERAQVPPPDPARQSHRRGFLVAAGASAVVAAAGARYWWVQGRGQVVSEVPTLAVLPFRPLVAQPRDELLEMGMADSLIARLSTVPGLVVRSPGSVRRYAGLGQDPFQSAKDLDVIWVVDGSLQRHDDWVRVTARLLHAADALPAWSGVFDEKFTNVFEVQDQISNRVMQALLPVLHSPNGTPSQLSEIGGTRNYAAYRLYLLGRWQAQGSRATELEKGIALLNQALSIDPTYAMGWLELAHLYRRKLWISDGLAADVFGASDAAVQRALALAPDLAEAHASMGLSRHWFAYDWAGAEQAFRHAQALNANCAIAHWGLATLLLTQDRLTEGFAHQRTARSLDPMSSVFNTVEGSFLLSNGQLTEARARLDRALEIAPNNWLTHLAIGLLLVAEQQPDQGVAYMRKAVTLSNAASVGARSATVPIKRDFGASSAAEASAR